MQTRLTLGTRRSPLARWQANHVRELLLAAGIADVTIVPIITSGDRHRTAALTDIGGKGLFLKELEAALLDRSIDLAVHSIKDMTADLAPGLALGGICRRGDARDVLVTANGDATALTDLPDGAIVGTCSPRRKCLLLHHRPDLRVRDLRGNVATRLERLDNGDLDAVVLAAAGLHRLGLAHRATAPLPATDFTPAAGQGAIGVEHRADDTAAAAAATAVTDDATAAAITAERAVVAVMGGGCHLPVGAHAAVDGTALTVHAMVGSTDGVTVLRDDAAGDVADAAALGTALGERLLAAGGAALVAAAG